MPRHAAPPKQPAKWAPSAEPDRDCSCFIRGFQRSPRPHVCRIAISCERNRAPLVANHFADSKGEVPPSFPLPHDLPLECTPSRKRSKEPSGYSSMNSPDQKVWPDPSSISSPFLDPQCLSAFSMTTQMNTGVEGTGGNRHTQKKKKKKGKSPPTA